MASLNFTIFMRHSSFLGRSKRIPDTSADASISSSPRVAATQDYDASQESDVSQISTWTTMSRQPESQSYSDNSLIIAERFLETFEGRDDDGNELPVRFVLHLVASNLSSESVQVDMRDSDGDWDHLSLSRTAMSHRITTIGCMSEAAAPYDEDSQDSVAIVDRFLETMSPEPESQTQDYDI